MTKSDVINSINGLAKINHNQNEFDFSSRLSNNFIEKCVDMANKMNVTPLIRPIDDEDFGIGIAFDYDESKNGLIAEIVVTNEGIWGYISRNDEQTSNFAFESETDAVNFWNVIIGLNC